MTGWSGRVGKQTLSLLQNIIKAPDQIVTAGRSKSDIYYSLEEGFLANDIETLTGAHIIHSAFDWKNLNPNNNINITGMRYLVDLAFTHNLHLTLISSYSANANSLSWYSRTKAEQESLLKLTLNSHILKLGILEDHQSHFSSYILKQYSRFPIQILPHSSTKFVISNLRKSLEIWHNDLNSNSTNFDLPQFLSLEEVLLNFRNKIEGKNPPRFFFIRLNWVLPVLNFIRKTYFLGNFLDSLIYLIEKRCINAQ